MINQDLFESHLAGLQPDEANVLRTYVDEAYFFETVIQSDLKGLPKDCIIVEVGGGIGLLALLLAEKGYQLVVYEPGAAGFGQMLRFRQIIMECWAGELPSVTWFDCELSEADIAQGLKSSFVYAINVIEHVPQTKEFLDLVMKIVDDVGSFRFICPNYLVPYEPHFNFVTLFNKRLTGQVMRKKIQNSTMERSLEFWDDLSWPTPRSLKREINSLGFQVSFSRGALIAYLDRATKSDDFIARKGLFGRRVLRPLARSGKALARCVPLSLSPILDCRVSR
jgi:hypothetical protein